MPSLARFASENGLRNETRLMWARVVSLDPRNVEAHLALGHVLLGGNYVDEAEANRAQGLVYFDGRWMTPAEQAFLLREREQRSDDERRASDRRQAAREEEDRERRAEAAAERARAAETNTVGLPVWGYGGVPWVGYAPGYGGRNGGSHRGGYGGGYSAGYVGGCVGPGCAEAYGGGARGYVEGCVGPGCASAGGGSQPRPPVPVATPMPRPVPNRPSSWR